MSKTTTQLRKQCSRAKAAQDNVGIAATERLIEFCFPGLNIAARYGGKHSDIAVPNLRSVFEEHNASYPGRLYSSFNEFLEALGNFIPGTIDEKGIYTNITYHRWVHTEVIKHVTSIL